MSAPSPDEWMAAAVESIREIAETLGFGDCTPLETPPPGAGDQPGSYIAVVGDDVSLQIGFLAEPKGHEALARRMLSLEEDADLPASDVADAACEIVNILAGGLKRGMSGTADNLKLGLPVFVEGKVHEPREQAHATTHVRVGDVPVSLVLFRGRSGAEKVTA